MKSPAAYRSLFSLGAVAALSSVWLAACDNNPNGPTSVNDASAASPASMARIGTSAAISAGTRGHSAGAARRSAPLTRSANRRFLTSG